MMKYVQLLKQYFQIQKESNIKRKWTYIVIIKVKNRNYNIMSFACINIFYGALWGITEATLGYLVHLTNISSTFVLLPIAFFFMKQAYKSTGKISSIFAISIISCIIKLSNIFTGIRIDKVINPVISILQEGCAFACYIFAINKLETKINKVQKYGAILIMNTMWRIAYCLYLICAPEVIYKYSILISTSKTIDFMITKNLGTSVIIMGLFLIEDKINLPTIKKVHPIIAVLSLILCMIII